MTVNQNIIKKLGFTRDLTAPEGVNRWEKSDGKTHFVSTFHVSITLSDDGSKTLYGVVNFYLSGGHGYISEHRSFDGVAISYEDLKMFMSRYETNQPSFVRVYPSTQVR